MVEKKNVKRVEDGPFAEGGWGGVGEEWRRGRRNRVFVDSKWRLYYCTYILLPCAG